MPKKIVKKTIKKSSIKKVKEERIGKITHHFAKIKVAILRIGKPGLKIGDKIHILGSTTDFEQVIKSMQIDHKAVAKAKQGNVIGLKVGKKVRLGDIVFKVK
ncbi:MAG: translation elongation factor-like protein [Patescibacteria group bacterium]